MTDTDNSSNFILNAVIGFLGLLLCLLLIALFARIVFPRIKSHRSDQNTELISDVIQIEVLNGCGKPGLAAKFTAALRDAGFDVVETGNFETFTVDKTTIIARTFDKENAKRIADALGVDYSQIVVEASENYYLDATVVIGEDYKTLNIH